MALVHLNQTVGTTATLICQVQAGLQRNVAIQIQNNDAASIFLGDSTITTSGAGRGHTIAAKGVLQYRI